MVLIRLTLFCKTTYIDLNRTLKNKAKKEIVRLCAWRDLIFVGKNDLVRISWKAIRSVWEYRGPSR